MWITRRAWFERRNSVHDGLRSWRGRRRSYRASCRLRPCSASRSLRCCPTAAPPRPRRRQPLRHTSPWCLRSRARQRPPWASRSCAPGGSPFLAETPPADAALPEITGPASLLEVAQHRPRERKPAQPQAESGALGKAGATSAPDKEKAPPDRADPKAAAPQPAPPEPDEWSDPEIIAALRDCLRRLAPLGAAGRDCPADPSRSGAGRRPPSSSSASVGPQPVEFQPLPMLNCAMVASLHTWVEKTLQPAAQELLGSPIVRIRNASGYACRNRVGSMFHGERLSEHALANAIDIAGFVTADGRTIDVLGQWGPTARDLREEQEKAGEAAAEAKAAAREAEKLAAEAARAAQGGARRQAGRRQGGSRAHQGGGGAQARGGGGEGGRVAQGLQARTAAMQKLGRGSDAGRGDAPRIQRKDARKRADAKGEAPTLADEGEHGLLCRGRLPAPPARRRVRHLPHGAGPRRQRGPPQPLPLRPGRPQAQHRVLRVGATARLRPDARTRHSHGPCRLQSA